MPSVNPIAEGAKSLSEGLNQAREAGKGRKARCDCVWQWPLAVCRSDEGSVDRSW